MTGSQVHDGRAWPAWADDDYFDGPGEATALLPPAEAGPGCPADDGPARGADGSTAPLFGPGGPAESMPPGPMLHALAERAVRQDLAEMTEDEVIGSIAAARRLRRRAEWLELRATREFAHRRWEADVFPVRDTDGRWRFQNSAAEHAADEIAFHLTDNRAQAQDRMDLSLALRDRLPSMDALVAAGTLDERRCQAVHDITSGLSDDHARRVDDALAPDAAGLGYDALRRRAAKLAMSLDPDSERERKQRATRQKARVERFLERSGNYALAGRELPVEEALASEAYIRGLAAYLRAHGVKAGQRDAELMCYLDLTQGRDPRDRIASQARQEGASAADGHAGSDEGRGEHGPGEEPDNGEGGRGDGGSRRPWPFSPPAPGKPGGHAPFPASINLVVPVGALLGWSTMPGEAGRDIVDPFTLRDMVHAASRHPATRWCVTVIGDDRTAIAHGCARGQHPWDGKPAPPQEARLAQLLGQLGVTLEPIAGHGWDEQHFEPGYRPSRKLQHLIRARTSTCPAPGCGASAHYSDIDHTIPWPDGPTAEGNLGPPCRHHHRTKQAPGWKLEQPEPGVFRWTTPAGRSYQTRPARYDV